MKTVEIEIALMEYFNIRYNLVVPNVFWGIGDLNYECDLVRLTKNNYATEVEIKISKQDLKRDKRKLHGHMNNLFKYLYFAVPINLLSFALKEIPERAGLFVVEETWKYRYRVKEVKQPILNKFHRKWTDSERLKLSELGSMRILGLKRKLLSFNLQSCGRIL